MSPCSTECGEDTPSITFTELMPVTHVIFDLDGLLLDTEPLYTIANNQILAKYGKEFSWELKRQQMGRTHDDAIKVLLKLTDLDTLVTVEEYSKDYDALLLQLFATAPLLPGAEKLVRHLHKHNIPIAICTGSADHEYKSKTSRHPDIFSLFSHCVAVSSDAEIKRGKPAPDCYMKCAERFAVQPASFSDVLVFEDAPNGVESGLAAGMQVVMVPDPRVEDTHRRKATLCLESLEFFDPSAFGLPPY
uniref:pseudouridine 5'-phosphatase n=1 Tax=Plectus sambesii TaxID=2011161 RepID=A0A914WLG1_9BILA